MDKISIDSASKNGNVETESFSTDGMGENPRDGGSDIKNWL
ncbi:MAG: hypothetical protein AAGA80_04850 [Cyanobacteria bacterium P01_F01_bin.143]